MKKLILFFFFIGQCLFGQSGIRFINYGPKANPDEGDNNYLQVINIKLPNDYTGNAFLRLYDISCGSSSDIQIGSWDSRFRFSIYKNEFTEENVLKEPTFKATNYSKIIRHFETGYDPRNFDKWYTFANLNNYVSNNSVYSLLVEGVEGNDGNAFEIFISSDSLSNIPVDGVEYFSYEPTISLRKYSGLISFITLAKSNDETLTLHTFDFDGTRSYFSSLLKDKIPNTEINPRSWNQNKYELTLYERDNYCSIDIGPQNNITNDITFYFTGSDNTKRLIRLPFIEKKEAEIPFAEGKISFVDCRTIRYEMIKEATKDKYIHLWSFDDGTKSEEIAIEKVFSKSGKYTGELFIVNTNSDAITHAKLQKLETVINEKPVIVLEKNITGAPNEKISFNATDSYDPDGKILSYEWDFGDGTIAVGQRVIHSFNKPGKYLAKLKVTDDYYESRCNYSIDSTLVIINSQPIPVTNNKIFGSVNEEIVFDASLSRDEDGSISSYTWDSQIFSAFGPKVKKKFSSPGKYKVTLTVQDNSTASNNKASLEIDLFINNPPVADAGVDRIVAPNEEINFDGTKSYDKDGSLIEYKWNFGDGKIINAAKATHSYSTPGKYLVYLTVKDDSKTTTDTSTDSVFIIVNKAPKSIAGEDLYLNNGLASFNASGSFDEDGTITKYEWDFGDGSKSEGPLVEHSYKVPGVYRVILKVTDNTSVQNNFDLDTVNVFINRRPIADAGPDLIVSTNQKVKFSSLNSTDVDGKIIKQKWYVDNKLISEEKEFEYAFDSPRTYIVGLEVSDDFKEPLSDIDFAVIKVNKPPVAVIDAPLIGVPNQKLKFSAEKSFDKDGSIIEYRWLINNSQEKKGRVIEHTFSSPGMYRVILYVVDNSNVANSIGSDTLDIKINSAPVVLVEDFISTCSNVVTIDASRSYDPDEDQLTFYWQIPNASKEKGSAIKLINFSEKGNLPVILYVDDGLGLPNSVVQKTITVKINRPPVANAGVDTTVCTGDIVIFSGLKSTDPENGLLKYEWSINDSIRLDGSNIVYKFKNGGVYKVKLKVIDDSGLPCNYNEDEKLVTVVEAPIADAGPDQTVCANTPVQFDGTRSKDVDGIVNNYEWDFGDGEFGGGATPVHIYTTPGIYKVTLTITGDLLGECDNTDKDEMIVTVVEAPVAAFKSETLATENKPVTFDASESKLVSGKIIKYLWDFGDSTSAEGKVVTHLFSKHGLYKVTLKIFTDSKEDCSTASLSKQIFINAKPKAVAIAPKQTNVNEIIEFSGERSLDPDGKIANYYWDLGDGTIKEGVKINYAFSKSGKFRVILKVEDNSKAENNFDYDTLFVSVNAEPKAMFNLPEFVYKGFDFVLDASQSFDPDGKITSFLWYLDDNKISDQKKTNYRIDKPGLYKIRLVVTDDAKPNSSSNELTKYLVVADYPSVDLTPTMAVCKDELFTIRPKIKYQTEDNSIKFQWLSETKKIISTSNDFTGTINKAGKFIYTFMVLNNANNILCKDSITLIVNTPPRVEKINNTTIYIGSANDEAKFEANVKDEDDDFISYEWNMGDGTIYKTPTVIHRYKKEGDYTVTLTVDDNKKTKCSKVSTSFNVKVVKIK